MAGFGGYELGSAINDYLQIQNTFARGTLDFLTFAIISGPAATAGYITGMGTGAIVGAISHPIINGAQDLGEIVSKGYKRITNKESDTSEY